MEITPHETGSRRTLSRCNGEAISRGSKRGIAATVAKLSAILIVGALAGCAEQPPKEPFLNKAGDQAKRTGTLIRTASTMAFKEIDPIKVTVTAGPPPSVSLTLGSILFNPPVTSGTNLGVIKLSSQASSQATTPGQATNAVTK